MALFTGKGDKGDTGTFGDKKRVSKSSTRAEALGTLDELNSYLGVCRGQEFSATYSVAGQTFVEILKDVQQHLFVVQAQIAGADKALSEADVKRVEEIVNTAETEMPPIKSFFLPGATLLGAHLDVARTTARRAERRVVAFAEEGTIELKEFTLPYLNRLSSLLYAMARLSNHKSGITEEPPHY